MTSKEAFELLKRYEAELLITKKAEVNYDDVISARYEISKLVEKDTPKKIEYNDWDDPCCPVCGEVQCSNVYAMNNDFCPYCGQRLDWSE